MKEQTAGEEITLKFDISFTGSKPILPLKQINGNSNENDSGTSSDNEDIPEDSDGVCQRVNKLNVNKIEFNSPFSSPKASSRSGSNSSQSSIRGESSPYEKQDGSQVKNSPFKLEGKPTQIEGRILTNSGLAANILRSDTEMTPTFNQSQNQEPFSFTQMVASKTEQR